ncbi:nucleotide-binding protein [Methanoculleus sp. FWC-SCC1]|uniref:Nucleotide-binding protein n=1 Tax=Methanoculleus frigidifontis TaxID=2584085 RepID=A0ABT8MCE5_9EURY|nr:OB-fold nucleic acid binding domain-containing protein [Methanoculleus sp. FWC-SCC1]MDN7025561.1 nucleotide-binding protein [Methanoculleus sp. FWC-SCC1]
MRFHYLLVDDLVTREAFEERVGETIAASGDLLDEQTAAMVVVREMGRAHVKIQDVSAASSLVCFFAKVVSVGAAREFEREDGTTGAVANVVVGDETGRARVVLWDEKAEAVGEIAAGDVLEVLGRPKGGVPPEVHATALQKAACEITCTETAAGSARAAPADGDLLVRLIAKRPLRTFTRRDGTPGEMVEAVVGDAAGVARLVAWVPALLEEFEPGATIRITGAAVKTGEQGAEYSLGESGTVAFEDAEIAVPTTPIAEVREGETYSVSGRVVGLQPPRCFTTRDGRTSWVRNLKIADATGEVPLVLWGDDAQEHLVSGDTIEVYNAAARSGRYNPLELSLGRGGALLVRSDEAEEIDLAGTVIATPLGVCIDTGAACYLIDVPLPVGVEVRIQGTLHRKRIAVRHYEAVIPDAECLMMRARRLVT